MNLSALADVTLEAIDLSESYESEGKRGHPEINSEDTYLAFVGGRFVAGKFRPVWFGWNFYGDGRQFDPPGTNHSSWKALWRIKGGEALLTEAADEEAALQRLLEARRVREEEAEEAAGAAYYERLHRDDTKED